MATNTELRLLALGSLRVCALTKRRVLLAAKGRSSIIDSSALVSRPKSPLMNDLVSPCASPTRKLSSYLNGSFSLDADQALCGPLAGSAPSALMEARAAGCTFPFATSAGATSESPSQLTFGSCACPRRANKWLLGKYLPLPTRN